MLVLWLDRAHLFPGDGTFGHPSSGRASRSLLMDAPFWEEAIRLLIALVVTGTFVLLVLATRRMNGYSAGPLLTYLTAVVGLNALWRWFIVVLGLTTDASSEWSRDVEPYIRSIGNALLILPYLGIAMLAWFHSRRR